MSKRNNSSRAPSCLGLGVTLSLLASGALIAYGFYRGDRVGTIIATTGTAIVAVGTTIAIASIAVMGAMAFGLLWFGLAIWNR